LDTAARSKPILRTATTSAAKPSPAAPAEKPARPDFVCVPHAHFSSGPTGGSLVMFSRRRRVRKRSASPAEPFEAEFAGLI